MTDQAAFSPAQEPATVRHNTRTPTTMTNQLTIAAPCSLVAGAGTTTASGLSLRLMAEAEGAFDGGLSEPALPVLLERDRS